MLPPRYELIYIIAGKDWRLPQRRLRTLRSWGAVWRICFALDNPHPAPFPLELALRMATVIDGPLADPFAGSGTMGMAAIQLGLPFTLNDISPAYKRMFQRRRKGAAMEGGLDNGWQLDMNMGEETA